MTHEQTSEEEKINSNNIAFGLITAYDTDGVFTAVRIPLRWVFLGPVFSWKITINEGGSITVNGDTIMGPKIIHVPLFFGYGRCTPGQPITPGESWLHRITGFGFGITIS